MSSSSRRPSSPCVSDIIHSTLSFTPCAPLSSKKARAGVLGSVHAVSTRVRVLILLEDISSPCCKYVGWPLGCWIALYFIAACMVKVDECLLWVAVCKMATTGVYVSVMSHLYAPCFQVRWSGLCWCPTLFCSAVSISLGMLYAICDTPRMAEIYVSSAGQRSTSLD